MLLQSLYGTGSNRKGPNKSPQETTDPSADRGGSSGGGSAGGSSGGGGSNDPELCSANAKIDAIFTEAGTTYVFKGELVSSWYQSNID